MVQFPYSTSLVAHWQVDKEYLQRLVAHSAVEGIVTDTEDFELKCKLVNCSPLTEKIRKKYPSAVREIQMHNSCKDSALIEMQSNGARFCRPDDLRRDVTKGAPCYSEVRPLTKLFRLDFTKRRREKLISYKVVTMSRKTQACIVPY